MAKTHLRTCSSPEANPGNVTGGNQDKVCGKCQVRLENKANMVHHWMKVKVVTKKDEMKNTF